MQDQTIICPKCKNEIPLTEALSSQIKEQIKREYESEYGKKSKELQQKENKLKEEISKIEKSKEEVDKLVKERTKNELGKLKEEAMIKAKNESARELNLLNEQLASKNVLIEDFKNQELELRKGKDKLEEEKRLLAVTKQREIDDAKKEIREKALAEVMDQNRLRDRQKDKIIEDLKRSLENAQRKANQSSQQLQGEVQELDLEEVLRRAFPLDAIEPVGKGIKGADVRQIIKTQLGNTCGVILWESKRTQGWKDEWLTKLKDDLRAEKANIPIIVTQTFPKGENLILLLREGVWICSSQMVLPLAEMMRQRLIEVAKEKFVSQNRTEKSELLYEYIISLEFRQQVEAIVEIYKEMHGQIIRERTVFEKNWKIREAQIQKLFLTTGGIVGSVTGRIGQSMPQIKGLELLESEGTKNNDVLHN